MSTDDVTSPVLPRTLPANPAFFANAQRALSAAGLIYLMQLLESAPEPAGLQTAREIFAHSWMHELCDLFNETTYITNGLDPDERLGAVVYVIRLIEADNVIDDTTLESEARSEAVTQLIESLVASTHIN